MNDLEKDFEKTAEAINAKIKEAAAALKEANRLASEAGLDSLIFTQWSKDAIRDRNRYADEPLDKYALQDKIDSIEEHFQKINVSDLENEMVNAGWSTSSSYC